LQIESEIPEIVFLTRCSPSISSGDISPSRPSRSDFRSEVEDFSVKSLRLLLGEISPDIHETLKVHRVGWAHSSLEDLTDQEKICTGDQSFEKTR
jgi:hypothetical protein